MSPFLPEGYILELNQPLNHPAFTTHKNYLAFIERDCLGLQLTVLKEVKRNLLIGRDSYKERITLIELTHSNIQQELQSIGDVPEYARVCNAWIAIKAYYLIFYLETVLLALINCNIEYLRKSHYAIRQGVGSLFFDNYLSASSHYLQKVVLNSDVNNFPTQARGSNLRRDSEDEKCYSLLMRKLTYYAKEEYKRMHKLKRLSGESKAEFLRQKISLLDFFYLYRIKSNYRDLEFIADDSVSTTDLVRFYKSYSKITFAVADALIKTINSIYQKRTGDTLALITTHNRG